MKKIAAMIKFENSELSEIKGLIKDYQDEFIQCENDVVTKFIETFLGRAFNPALDAKYFEIKQYPDKSEYYYKDQLIGTLTNKFDYHGDDFMQNKVSCVISFTPNLNYGE